MGLRGGQVMSSLTKALNRPNDASSVKRIVVKVLLYILLIFVAVLTVFPYLWMLFTTFKDPLEAMMPSLSLFPETFLTDSYKQLANLTPSFLRSIGNTMIIEVAVVPIGTFVTALAAFAFAKMRLPCKHFLLLFLMSGMMVPYAVVLLPQYRAYSALEWTGTLLPLIIPGLFGNIGMMFFFIQYMKNTPDSLIEAGRIDGASWLRIFWTIVLPTIVPAIAAQVIFWFLGIWNDYFGPSIYLSGEWLTVQALLALLNDNNARRPDLPLVMAGATISSLPVIVLYVVFQKYFVQSLALTGIKE